MNLSPHPIRRVSNWSFTVSKLALLGKHLNLLIRKYVVYCASFLVILILLPPYRLLICEMDGGDWRLRPYTTNFITMQL